MMGTRNLLWIDGSHMSLRIQGSVSKRIAWIDLGKGVGIVCVILGHMQIPDPMRKFIFSFHMPFFFLVSGYLQKVVPFRKFISSRANGLIVPYLLYSLPSVALLSLGGAQGLYALEECLRGNGVYSLWFLTSLFCISTLGWILSRFCKNVLFKLAIAFFVAVIGWMCPFFRHSHFLSLHTWAPGFVFWVCGCCLAQVDAIAWFRNLRPCWKFVICLSLVSIGVMCFLNDRVSLAAGQIGNPLIFYPVAMALSCLLILVSSIFSWRSHLLEWMGRNSLSLMVLHMMIPVLMGIVLMSVGVGISGGIEKIVMRILNLGLLFGSVHLIDWHIPLLAGRKKLFV